MHFCSGLPIILVGCKNDLRDDPNTIEALRATNQKPVSTQDVSFLVHVNYTQTRRHADLVFLPFRLRLLPRRSVPTSTWSALLEPATVFVRSLSTPLVPPSCLAPAARAATRSALFCKHVLSLRPVHLRRNPFPFSARFPPLFVIRCVSCSPLQAS